MQSGKSCDVLINRLWVVLQRLEKRVHGIEEASPDLCVDMFLPIQVFGSPVCGTAHGLKRHVLLVVDNPFVKDRLVECGFRVGI